MNRTILSMLLLFFFGTFSFAGGDEHGGPGDRGQHDRELNFKESEGATDTHVNAERLKGQGEMSSRGAPTAPAPAPVISSTPGQPTVTGQQSPPYDPRRNPVAPFSPGFTPKQGVQTSSGEIIKSIAVRAGFHLLISDGDRSPSDQAQRIYDVIRDDAVHHNVGSKAGISKYPKALAAEVVVAYEANKTKEKSVVIQAMSEVIKNQIAKGNYISKHLRAGAFDISVREKTGDFMSVEKIKQIVKAIQSDPQLKVVIEFPAKELDDAIAIKKSLGGGSNIGVGVAPVKHLHVQPLKSEPITEQTLPNISVQQPLDFSFHFALDLKGGREWHQVNEKLWEEHWEDGTIRNYECLGKGTVDGVPGMCYALNPDKALLMFIPDMRWSDVVKWRAVGEDWRELTSIEHVQKIWCDDSDDYDPESLVLGGYGF